MFLPNLHSEAMDSGPHQPPFRFFFDFQSKICGNMKSCTRGKATAEYSAPLREHRTKNFARPFLWGIVEVTLPGRFMKRNSMETPSLQSREGFELPIAEAPPKKSRTCTKVIVPAEQQMIEFSNCGGAQGIIVSSTSSPDFKANKCDTTSSAVLTIVCCHKVVHHATDGDPTTCQVNLSRLYDSTSLSCEQVESTCCSPTRQAKSCHASSLEWGSSCGKSKNTVRGFLIKAETCLACEMGASKCDTATTASTDESSNQQNSTFPLESLGENELDEEVTQPYGSESILENLNVEVGSEGPVDDEAGGWDLLPNAIQDNISQRLEYEHLFRLKTVSKTFKNYTESETSDCLRGKEGSFTALNFLIRGEAWHCSGFDLYSNEWRRLPTFHFLPLPDINLFKEYSVCGHGGLMCANVSKLPQQERLIVFNPLIGKKRELPPLNYRRNPVLMHLLVDPATNSYRVIVAGSSSSADVHLSRRTEVFDSRTSVWKVTSDVPGPSFGINEHQAGVYLDGILYCIGFMEGECGRGVLSYNVEESKWLTDRTCPLPFSTYSNIVQLVENKGKVYLFSEREHGRSVEHCIDVLEKTQSQAEVVHQWRNVITDKKISRRGLQVYPEYSCVPYGEGKLCIFNTIERKGVVYSIQDAKRSEILQPPPPGQGCEGFFSLNPLSFTFEPNFSSKVF